MHSLYTFVFCFCCQCFRKYHLLLGLPSSHVSSCFGYIFLFLLYSFKPSTFVITKEAMCMHACMVLLQADIL